MTGALGTNSQALWYMTRGFGLLDLVLLTATMVMGLTQVVRYARPGWPRFVVSALHKNISLLAVVFLGVHVATAVLDTFAPISIASVFIPFVGKYRPLWLGLGALSLDLLVALVVTSLVRERMGQRAWRLLHWAAYLCWPVAIVHGLGTGTDTKLGWVLAINAACVAAGVGAIWWRLAERWRTAAERTPAGATKRLVAAGSTLAVPLIVGVWTLQGPLQPGWARRAGTPTALLGPSVASASSQSSQGAASSQSQATAPSLPVPFQSSFRAVERREGSDSSGQITLVFDGTFSAGTFTVTLTGTPADGGIQLTSGKVAVGPSGSPGLYQGAVTQLQGDTIGAGVSGGGRSMNVTIQLTGRDGSIISGTIEASA
ncbi:MAG TPA: ferric reductase-like transmembrane domain-containing protein [Acidimicrobiales bacterium]|nr:ferric reductase-like transmembrane domain-containing protein [Acidimicrobiales bacterium]